VDRRVGGISTGDIQDAIKHPVSAELPSEPAAALVSVNKGTPVVLADSKNPLARALFDLAHLVRDGKAAASTSADEDEDRPRPVVASEPEMRGLRGQLARMFGRRTNGHAVAGRR
jgi:hypothetical protein